LVNRGDAQIAASVVLGEGVELGRGVVLGEGVVVGPHVRLGDHVVVGAGARLGVALEPSQPPLVLEEHARIGERAVVLAGLTIGRHATVSASSVVEASVPSHACAMGAPASLEGLVSHAPVALPSGVRLVALPNFIDPRGRLTVLESPREVPFVAARVFMVDGVPTDVRRGAHAHHECEQFLFCAGGSCVVTLDDGTCRAIVVLESGKAGLYIPRLTWASEERFAPGTQLVVLASHPYDPAGYIHDYRELRQLVAPNLTRSVPS
jgi:UDP-2-acetamido-3-amino-2,3-dideoxy-glucuronate N-acetyltransferase